MKNWELFKSNIEKCESSDQCAALIRSIEILAMEWCSRHLPDMVECYRDNNPESKRASIYGLEAFLRSEVDQKGQA